jgi:hypothetical protein
MCETLYGVLFHNVILRHTFALMSSKVMLCFYNGDLIFPASNIAVAWSWIAQKCSDNHQEPPHSYVQVTRLVGKEGRYIHHCAPGKWFEIAERKVIRKDRKQLVLPIDDTVVKQS